MTKQAQLYIYGVIAAGALAVGASLANGLHVNSPVTFSIYLSLAILASLFKMRLPGMESTYSLNTLFILFGLYYLSPGETIVAGCLAVAVQSHWRAHKRPTPVQVAFNLANVALSIGAAFAVTNTGFIRNIGSFRPAAMAAAAFVQFAVNTLLVSGVLSLLEGKPLKELWNQWYQWSFPYYVIGAALVALLPIPGQVVPPQAWLILLPLLYLVHFFCGLSLPGRASSAAIDAAPPAEKLSAGARLYVSAAVCIGGVLLAKALIAFDAADTGRFLACLALGLLASTWKVRLPGTRATLSAGFVVTLFTITEMPFSQALVISAALCAVQALWRPKLRLPTVQMFFSVANVVIGAALAYWIVRGGLLPGEWTQSVPATLAIATGVLFCVNTLMVSAAVCLANAKPLTGIWQDCYFWSFPYYLVGACAAAVMVMTSRTAGWLPATLVLPLMWMVYLSYRMHVSNAVARSIAISGQSPA